MRQQLVSITYVLCPNHYVIVLEIIGASSEIRLVTLIMIKQRAKDMRLRKYVQYVYIYNAICKHELHMFILRRCTFCTILVLLRMNTIVRFTKVCAYCEIIAGNSIQQGCPDLWLRRQIWLLGPKFLYTFCIELFLVPI